MGIMNKDFIFGRLMQAFSVVIAMLTMLNIAMIGKVEEKPDIKPPETREISARYEEKIEISEEEEELSGNSKIDYEDDMMMEIPRKQKVQMIAKELIGHFRYKFGNKANYLDPEPVSMDCSGFVQYVYWLATKNKNENLHSTLSITHNMTLLDENEGEPQIGDIGVMFPDGSYYFDIEGNKYYNRIEAENANNIIKETAEKDLQELELAKRLYDEKHKKRKVSAKAEAVVSEESKNNFYNQLVFSDCNEDINVSDSTYAEPTNECQLEGEMANYYSKKKELEDRINKASEDPESHINHCGIIVDIDEETGEYIFCHLNSADGTVTMEKYPKFKYFYHVPE